MNFNNQELNSFLSVPGDHQEQPFPSLSPQRSVSPISSLSEQIQQQNQKSNSTNSSLGSFRTRTRAGTLPSRLYSNSVSSNISNGNQSYSPSFNPNPTGLNPNSLNFDAFSISHTAPPNQLDSINASVTGNVQPRTRLRSGSLLGLSESNSIWGDTSNQQSTPSASSISSLAPPNEFTQGTISPSTRRLQSQTIDENPISRAKAYSTSNALVQETSNYNYYLQNLEENRPYNFNPSQQIPQLHDQLNALPQFQEQNRPRAQSYQNGSQGQLSLIFNSQSSISGLPEATQNLYPSKPHLTNEQPLLLDKIDSRSLNWISTFQESSLGPTNTLFLSKLPAQSVSPLSLVNLLIKFGRILTVRVFIGNDSALVEFESLESAMQAKAQLNHQELMPGFACIVTFAKILPPQRDHSPPAQPNYHKEPQHQQLPTLSTPNIQINASEEHKNSVDIPDVSKTINDKPPELPQIVDDIYEAITKLGVSAKCGSVGNIISNALKYKGYDNDFGPLPDPIPIREFDAPKLRETRKAIDVNQMSQFEIEELSIAILDELPELSSDYLGNTVVQKLFQFSSTSTKLIMLKEVAPYLAQMGIHKNGTWSAQKMISVADTPSQKAIVAKSLKQFCVPLFNDQFGNYVIQCSLKFGSPWNDFIFEVILAKFWLIVQNRFGARAIRACLESHEASVEQTAIISAAIILHAEHLAINQNAALLITWFLDTCTLPNRHLLIAPRLIPHLGQLCTHKLASLTVLKILNNRYEVDAKNLILNALFGQVPEQDEESDSKSPKVLEQILRDNVHGASFVFKVLSNPQLEVSVRQHIISQARKVLLELNVGSYQGYKRLLDEVGLSNRSEGNRHSRTHLNGGNGNGNQRSKNRQSKTSPNQTNRRSNSNSSGFRPQQSLIQRSIPSQPQFVQNSQTDYLPTDLQHQFYRNQDLLQQQQFQKIVNYAHEVPLEFDRLNYPPQFQSTIQPFNNSFPSKNSISFSQQPQFGYDAQL